MITTGILRIASREDLELLEEPLVRLLREHLEYPGEGYCENSDQERIVCKTVFPEMHHEEELIDIRVYKSVIILYTSRETADLYIDSLRDSLVISKLTERLGDVSDLRIAFQKILEHIASEYHDIVEFLSEKTDLIDEEIEREDLKSVIEKTHNLRRNLVLVKRSMRNYLQMLREIYNNQRILSFAHNTSRVFELIDEISIDLEVVEILRETLSSFRELLTSILDLRLNEVVKRLTAVTVVLMLPTLIASIYGMNFDRSQPLNMPELSWGFGYIYALTLMLVSSILGYVILKLRGWV
ncbi:MAG: magnesium transporter CorA family protein [Sulfolobales archaeon]